MIAGVAELVDARHSKCRSQKECRFDSDRPHQSTHRRDKDALRRRAGAASDASPRTHRRNFAKQCHSPFGRLFTPSNLEFCAHGDARAIKLILYASCDCNLLLGRKQADVLHLRYFARA
jgi:hypothetical protein